MFVPDLCSGWRAGHSQPVSWIGRYARGVRCVALLLAAGGCSSGKDSVSDARGSTFHPWVEGGQTGALIPECGLTRAARAGDSTPGGDTAIVIQTDSCVGLAVAELELFDQDGMMVEFDVETLPGGALLLRPRAPLPAGVYVVKVAGKEMESLVGDAPAALPSELGELERIGDGCGASFSLRLNPALLEYLPQLKLSVAIDGGPDATWFDYGALDVVDGRAALSLSQCFPSCLGDGTHSLRLTAELAGELGTLAPIELMFDLACGAGARAAGAAPEPEQADGGSAGGCQAFGGQTGGECSWLLALALIAAALALRRSRQSSA